MKKKIEIPALGVKIEIVLVENVLEYAKEKFEYPDNTEGLEALVVSKDGEQYYVILNTNPIFASIAHESVHCIGRIFHDRGQKADFLNDELFAYHVGWLSENIYELVITENEGTNDGTIPT